MSKIRVLVVDDEAQIANLICEMLNDEYDVLVTADSVQAKELAESRAFDVFITDYNMPGINGLRLCESFKRSNPLASTVIITGSCDYEFLEASPYVNLVLRKPINFTHLIKIMSGFKNAAIEGKLT